MDVNFVSKQKGNTVIQCPELGPKHVIRFVRGRFKTSNKKEIKRLLSGDYARRNTSLAPGQDLEKISDYLDSPDRPDVFTKEYLDAIPFELWEEILTKTSAINVKFPLVGIAKSSLEGKPIDPVIEQIVDEHHENTLSEAKEEAEKAEAEAKAKEEAEAKAKEEAKVKEEAEKAEAEATKSTGDETTEKGGDTVESSEANVDEGYSGPTGEGSSKNHSVRSAQTYLAGKEYSQVEGFIHPDEDRVSLIKYWNDRYPEHSVEVPTE